MRKLLLGLALGGVVAVSAMGMATPALADSDPSIIRVQADPYWHGRDRPYWRHRHYRPYYYRPAPPVVYYPPPPPVYYYYPPPRPGVSFYFRG